MHWFFAAQGLSLGTASGATLGCRAWFSLWWHSWSRALAPGTAAQELWCAGWVGPWHFSRPEIYPVPPAVAVNSWPLDHQGNPGLLTVSSDSSSLCPSHPRVPSVWTSPALHSSFFLRPFFSGPCCPVTASRSRHCPWFYFFSLSWCSVLLLPIKILGGGHGKNENQYPPSGHPFPHPLLNFISCELLHCPTKIV